MYLLQNRRFGFPAILKRTALSSLQQISEVFIHLLPNKVKVVIYFTVTLANLFVLP